MIQKKIVMLGSFAVGKTSLVARYVRSIFSEKYLTTIGVKVDKKEVALGDGLPTVLLLLWDLYGDDEFQAIRPSLLRGASGYFLVADGTRPASLERLLPLHQLAQDVLGNVPYLILLNKTDLVADWALSDKEERRLSELGPVIKTSAKTGIGVDEAFVRLSSGMLAADGIIRR
ncbi:MAG TPA: Rab family GTPase [Pseudomonadota bacterium]|nr:Rab family GTPase [Pseudomonadota bacterium]